MRISKLALGASAAALIAAPIAAQADLARASAPVSGESELGAETEITPAAIVAGLAAIGIAVLLLTDDDDDDEPISA